MMISSSLSRCLFLSMDCFRHQSSFMQVPTAVFAQPTLASVGLTEEQAIQSLEGDIDVYVSKFRPMKNTLSGRNEKTFMKMLVHCLTDKVRTACDIAAVHHYNFIPLSLF